MDTAPGVPTRTYLFCGDQYVRYTGTGYDTVDLGYPRALADLRTEPRLGNLDAALNRVDGALADRRTVHLFSGRDWYAASDAAYRRYDGLGLDDATCVLVQDGAVVAEHPDGWRRHGSLEGEPGPGEPVRPRVLRTVPAEFRTGLDAVLHGADGNTYLFKGGSCFDTRLKREVPVADEWGRARNTIYEDDAVDAAFVAADGRTYVFRGDQFVSYAPGADYAGRTERDPLPIAEHWGGLRDVAVAFVRDGADVPVRAPGPRRHVRLRRLVGQRLHRRPGRGVPSRGRRRLLGHPGGVRPRRLRRAGRRPRRGRQPAAHRRSGLPAAGRADRHLVPAAAAGPGLARDRQARRADGRVHRAGRQHVLLLPRRLHPLPRPRVQPPGRRSGTTGAARPATG